MKRRGLGIVSTLFIVAIVGVTVASFESYAPMSAGAVTPTPTCLVEEVDAFCRPILHRVIPPHSQIRMAGMNGQRCGAVPGMAPLCTTPMPAVVVVNDADVTAIADETADLAIVTFTFPYGFIANPDSTQCVVNERENVAACPVVSVTLNASPETFTTSPLPPNQWELVTNPFDVPARVSLGGAGDLWMWDGAQYNATDELDPRQAAWAIVYAGGSLQLTALPLPTPACLPADCP